MLSIDPHHPLPIWRQIQDGLRRLIASGALAPGDPVPSVRELARQLRVNPLTVRRATRELVDSGVLEIRRGQGTFVAASPPTASAAGDDELARAATRFASLARTLGLGEDDARRALARAFAELDDDAPERPAFPTRDDATGNSPTGDDP